MATVISAKGHASQEVAGNLHRRTSLAVRRAGGFKEFEPGRATQKAADDQHSGEVQIHTKPLDGPG
jgi:hypothetical protein